MCVAILGSLIEDAASVNKFIDRRITPSIVQVTVVEGERRSRIFVVV